MAVSITSRACPVLAVHGTGEVLQCRLCTAAGGTQVQGILLLRVIRTFLTHFGKSHCGLNYGSQKTIYAIGTTFAQSGITAIGPTCFMLT
ncbi:hypothetical protein GDO78_023099 [Eleutherodactylus coqui]|uniref:Uncharacterized protein n=1 Tax=Eleutherodactylus coqui TaxID=57060 RepID=A0A8J6AY89_ELECQ|nr:hypothetical protein GDO78_023099 [Eleutherodactylus coqui]